MQRVYPCGGGPVRLVSTDWVAERLREKKFMILDCQPNVHDYIQEHIPGAIYLNENHFRYHVQNGPPARFVGPEAAEPVIRSAGLKADVPVVVYTGVGAAKGWGDGIEQTMVAYSLARYGHDNVFVLDGGLDEMEGRGQAYDQRVWDGQTLPIQSDSPGGLFYRIRGIQKDQGSP